MTEKELKNQIINRQILIYGAGITGGLVYKRLRASGIDDNKIKFVVTETDGKQYFMGKRIYALNEVLNEVKESIILLSVQKINRTQMLLNLKRLNIADYLIVDEELYADMEKHYIQDFLTENDIPEGEKDVLFMASDNNSSSGAFLCLVDINCELKKRGVRSLVILPAYGNGEKLLKDNEIDYTYVPSMNWLYGLKENIYPALALNDTAIDMLSELIRKYKIKLVHNNTTYTYVGAKAAIREGIPYIWHIREYIREQGFWFVDERTAYELINGAAAVLPVSEYVADCYGGIDHKKINIVYDGIDTKRYSVLHELFTKPKARILMPGAMIPLKGQTQLIKAAVELKRMGIEFYISFVGSGEADYIKALKNMVLDNDLEGTVGFYERSFELEKWYQASDIVVVCSGVEAFGRVTVEAQLAGCVVVAADRGATPELITDGESGYLYRYGDHQMLAEKIAYVISHKEKVMDMAARVHNDAKKKFSREVNADALLKIYADAVSGKS